MTPVRPAPEGGPRLVVRYRRLAYRYALVLAAQQPQALGYGWQPGRVGVVLARPRWRPRADVVETPDAVVITAELSGVDPDDIEILLYDDAVVVTGTRRVPPVADGVYHTAEVPQGPFELDVALPAMVHADATTARYEDGFLRLDLPKTNGDGRGR